MSFKQMLMAKYWLIYLYLHTGWYPQVWLQDMILAQNAPLEKECLSLFRCTWTDTKYNSKQASCILIMTSFRFNKHWQPCTIGSIVLEDKTILSISYGQETTAILSFMSNSWCPFDSTVHCSTAIVMTDCQSFPMTYDKGKKMLSQQMKSKAPTKEIMVLSPYCDEVRWHAVVSKNFASSTTLSTCR